MIGPKKCPLWVDHSDTDPLLWNRMFQAPSLWSSDGTTAGSSFGTISAEIGSSLIWAESPGASLWTGLLRICWWFQAVSPLCLLVFLVRGRVAAGCCWLCETVARGWLRGPQRLTLRWFRHLAASCCHGSSFEMRLQGTILSEDDTECFGGFNLTPRRFYKFFLFLLFVFDILELLNADN